MKTVYNERTLSERLAATNGRLRVGCRACDFVTDLEHPPRRSEVEIHTLRCPACGTVGFMHEYPTVGSWPSDYEHDECPVAPAPTS